MLDITARKVKLLELKYKGRRLKCKRNHSAWPTNLEKEIIEGIKDAERELLKTVEEKGMVPGLREANIVYKNPKTGELTCLNTATEAYISEKDLFQDELSVVSVDELFDLENEILLDNIDSTDVAEIDGLTGIIADEMRSEQSEIIFDEGDPRNCQLYEKGNCKYFQKDFAEPATTYWIDCEFPGCGYWWHEVCMGIKFKSKTERDKYLFICPSHDCGNTDLYSDKVTTSKEDKSILSSASVAVLPKASDQRKRERFH